MKLKITPAAPRLYREALLNNDKYIFPIAFKIPNQ